MADSRRISGLCRRRRNSRAWRLGNGCFHALHHAWLSSGSVIPVCGSRYRSTRRRWSVLYAVVCRFPHPASNRAYLPFFDMRIGYSGRVDDCRFDCGGAYLNPSIGVTWTPGRRVGMELAVGYTYQDAVILDIEMGGMPIVRVRKNIGGLNIRLGVTF